MVTTQEARSQVAIARAQVAQQKSQIQSQRLSDLTTAERRKQTRSSMISRRLQASSLATQKSAAIKSLEPIEKQIAEQEIQVAKVEAENVAAQKAYERRGAEAQRIRGLRKLAVSGKPLAGLSKSDWRIVEEARAGKESQLAFVSRSKVIKEVTGLSNLEFAKADLSKYSNVKLKKLERAGAVSIEVPKETMTTTKLSPKYIQPTPTPVKVEQPSFFSKAFNVIKKTPTVQAISYVGSKFIELEKKGISTVLKGVTEPVGALPEDYFTARELYQKGNYPAALRAIFTGKIDKDTKGIGQTIFSWTAKTVQPGTVAKFQKTGQFASIVAEGGKIAGTPLLYGTLLTPVSATTAQTQIALQEPTKIKILGLTQTKKGGLVKTEIIFEAKRQGVREVGRAVGVSKTSAKDILPSSIKVVESQVIGGTGRPGVLFPIGKKLILGNQASFKGAAQGFAQSVGKQNLIITTAGKTTVKQVGYGGSAQKISSQNVMFQTTKKSLTRFFGGSVSPDKTPLSTSSGYLFESKSPTQVFLNLFKSPVGKGGQVLLVPQKFIPPTTTLTTVESGVGLASTLGTVGAFGSTLGTIPTGSLFLSLSGAGLSLFPKTKETITTKELLSTKQKPIYVTPQDEAIITKSKTAIATATSTAQIAKSTTTTITIPALTTATVTIPKLKTATTTIPTITPRLRFPVVPIIFPIISETPTLKKLTVIAKKKHGVNIVVGMKLGKKKVIAKNMPPFKALKKAQRYIDRNIEASFKLVPTKKKARGKDISKVKVNRKFRASKKNALYIVERRKFRLDMPGEKKQIKSKKGKKLKGRLLSFR